MRRRLNKERRFSLARRSFREGGNRRNRLFGALESAAA